MYDIWATGINSLDLLTSIHMSWMLSTSVILWLQGNNSTIDPLVKISCSSNEGITA